MSCRCWGRPLCLPHDHYPPSHNCDLHDHKAREVAPTVLRWYEVYVVPADPIEIGLESIGLEEPFRKAGWEVFLGGATRIIATSEEDAIKEAQRRTADITEPDVLTWEVRHIW